MSFLSSHSNNEGGARLSGTTLAETETGAGALPRLPHSLSSLAAELGSAHCVSVHSCPSPQRSCLVLFRFRLPRSHSLVLGA